MDIEYHSSTPPPPNLRQQFEDALPPNRYRLVRIARKYLPNENTLSSSDSISLEPPTPAKLFQQLWDKQGYSPDEDVLKDFISLVDEAEKSLEEQHGA